MSKRDHWPLWGKKDCLGYSFHSIPLGKSSSELAAKTQPLNHSMCVCVYENEHPRTHQYPVLFVLVFADLVTSSEPTLAWSPDTATVLEGHMMKIKVSTTSCGVSGRRQMVREDIRVFCLFLLQLLKRSLQILNAISPTMQMSTASAS